MDRELPFGFLDHKVKCGNALVGAWFDQFQHYPAMAWKNREGGDKTHSNGVHFEEERPRQGDQGLPQGPADARHEALPRRPDAVSGGPAGSGRHGARGRSRSAGLHARTARFRMQRSVRKSTARIYWSSKEWRWLKDAMDLWCACWFWPVDEIEHAPLPTSFADPPEETRTVAK